MNFQIACLLLGVEIAIAEVYNYGAGTVNAGNPLNVNPNPNPGFGAGGGLDFGNLGGANAPGNGGLFTANPGVGGLTFDNGPSTSWTYAGSSNFNTNQNWFGTTQSWSTPPISWSTQQLVPITNQVQTETVPPGFTRYNGNCQGNYLGAVTQLSLEACAAACQGTPACAGFSFNCRSPYPQCILKNAICTSPDTAATFTFFARNGYQPTQSYYPPYPVPPPYDPIPPPYVPPPPPPPVAPFPAYPYPMPTYPYWQRHHHHYGGAWKSASIRQFKRLNAQFYELPANCSGPIMRGPYIVLLETCAEDCSLSKACTGFSFDNSTDACILHTGICQTMQPSNQWAYYARGDRNPQVEMTQADVMSQPSMRQQQHYKQQQQQQQQQSAYQQQLQRGGFQEAAALEGYEGQLPQQQQQQQQPKLQQQAPQYQQHQQQLVERAPIQRAQIGKPVIPPRNAGFPYNVNPMDLLSRFDQVNGNCPGNALGETINLSLDECARMCLESFSCAGFSFNIKVTRPEDYQCMLKTQSCTDPSETSPYRFFRRRSLNTFNMPANARYRQSSRQ